MGESISKKVDLSSNEIENEGRPQFCPLIPIYTKKGKEGNTYVTPNQFDKMFGSDSLEVGYNGHTIGSEYALLALENKNNSVIHRVIPDDAKLSIANMYLAIELAPSQFPEPKRTHLGEFIYDVNGDIENTNNLIDGFTYRLIFVNANDASSINDDDSPMYPSDWVPVGSTGGSFIVPYIEFQATSYGSDYNNIGFSLSTTPQTEEEIEKSGEIKYRLKRFDRGPTGVINTPTEFGDDYIDFSLYKDNFFTEEVQLGLLLQMEKAFTKVIGNLNIEDIKISAFKPENIRAMLEQKILPLERLLISDVAKIFDDGITSTTKTWYVLNSNDELTPELTDFLNFKTAKGVKFQSIKHFDRDIFEGLDRNLDIKIFDSKEHLPHFLANGIDGTMDQSNLEASVITLMKDYGDEFSKYHNTAINLETNLFDFDYSLETKLTLSNFLLHKGNTCVSFSTDEVGIESTNDSRFTIVDTINNHMNIQYESEEYDTNEFRYTINFGSGIVTDRGYDIRLSQSYELFKKLSDYMGRSSGNWVKGGDKTIWLGDRVDTLHKLLPTTVTDFRESLWVSNSIFSDSKDLKQYYLTSGQTGYTDENSILNNILVMQAKLTLSYYNDDVWREVSGFTGRKEVLRELVVTSLSKKIKGRFDNLFFFKIDISFNENNINIWNINITLYGGVLRTKHNLTLHKFNVDVI